ncbi:MAG: methylmalonyl Co-A mutase-associated GTPase MeaB [Bacteroidetes bacterium QS_9_68_14]|nr:MAG: methylmalonyl Co-A mutase-associated GTPase MeaB [Bacteroidetes bacterium QS_9_68_14]
MPAPDADAASRTSINPRLSDGGSPRATPPAPEALAQQVRAGDRAALSRAITLVESTRAGDRSRAQALLEACRPAAGTGTVRVAITGVPGAGKSTFLETLGAQLLGEDPERCLAVLAIDPSSTRSGGSILGDKTRMGELASHRRAFVRPSPTAGTLGGVARRTRESILLCEAAGYDTIFVETVGVGQAEVEVHAMTDVFLLLALAGAGDRLQAVKRGVVEMADLVAVNKADSGRAEAAENARAEYENALRLFPLPETGERPPVLTCSARTGAGVAEVWQAVQRLLERSHAQGLFEKKRRRQARRWLRRAAEERLRDAFFGNETVEDTLPDLEDAVEQGDLSAAAAAERLLEAWQRADAPDP